MAAPGTCVVAPELPEVLNDQPCHS